MTRVSLVGRLAVRVWTSPLGQRTASATVLDSSALDQPVVYVSGGRRGLDIGMAPADLVMLTNAEVARIAPIVR